MRFLGGSSSSEHRHPGYGTLTESLESSPDRRGSWRCARGSPGLTWPAVERIETCNSIWLLDPALMQFCRMPKGADPAYAVSARWQTYVRLEEDAETGAFRVALDDSRTRWLSSRRHVEPCGRCQQEWTRPVVMPPPPCAVVGDLLQ